MLFRLGFLNKKKQTTTDEYISGWLVKNEYKIPRDKEIIVKIRDKFYKIKELG